MRVAYLDCFSGLSGDMFLGALVDAGVPLERLQQTVAALDVGATLEASTVQRCGVRATKVDVIVAGEKDLPREVFHAQRKQQLHQIQPHQHPHPHSPSHAHDHPQDHGPGHEYHPDTPHKHSHRGGSLREIREIIARLPISTSAKARATGIFEALGIVEAGIHQVDLESIHFHEVGSADAIVDIVCASVGAEELGVDEWICSPLNVGGGTVDCAHGTFPVPAPATLELLRRRNAPIYSSGIQKELVTPTGAAILHVLANRFAPLPAMRVTATGYGAGYRDLREQPNIVRLTVGEIDPFDTKNAPLFDTKNAPLKEADSSSETVGVLEANMDDLSPQVFGYVVDRLLSAGALDVFATPVQMKKSRPGTLLTVLCRPQQAEALAHLIFIETSTIGIRIREEKRQCLTRRHVAVPTRWGEVRIKVASLHGSVTNFAPEYEDCRRLAAENGVPLKTVMQEALCSYLDQQQ
jgi:uncharacterized protein (TIGR00299 family) protein